MGTKWLAETKQWINRLAHWMRYKKENLCYNKTSLKSETAFVLEIQNAVSDPSFIDNEKASPMIQQSLDSATVRQSPLSSFFIRIVNAASVAGEVIS